MTRLKGTIKYVDPNGKFGVISRDDKGPKAYVYIESIREIGIDSIVKNHRFEFEIISDSNSRNIAVKLTYLGMVALHAQR